MNAPYLLRAAGATVAALMATAAAPRRASPPTGEVTAVSVLPAAGRVELVVDVQGTVEVSDFVLRDPARVVLDLVGARLTAPVMGYDGVNRGGIRNVRYSQFRSDVVRVVVELDEARDYELRNESGSVRLSLAAAGEPFSAWSSDAARARAGVAAPQAAPRDVVASPQPAGPPPLVAPAALPAAIPRAAPAQGSSQERRIDVRFDRASIHEVAAQFAEYSGRSIIVRSDLQVLITADIRNQPWDVALRAILDTYGLAGVEQDGIIRIVSRSEMVVSTTQEPLTTRSVRINYARASSLAPAVRSIVSQGDTVPGAARGRVEPDTVTNSLIITDVVSRIDSVVAFVRTLDQRTPQVAIQARIIFVDRTDLEELGLRYDLGTSSTFFNRLIQRPDLVSDPSGATTFEPDQTVINLGGNGVAAIANARERLRNGNPALELVYSTVLGNFALSAFLDALQQVSLADVEAVPSVTIADNRESEIFSGERTPIRVLDPSAGVAGARANVSFQETGIKLRVTPHVVRETREVLMELFVERSFVTPSAASDVGAAFATQRNTGQVLVRDGETIVIGGLTVTEVTVTKTGVPFLVDLPVIGRLFGFRSTREQRRDLIILVTPHIVDDLQTAGTGGTNR